MIFHLLSVAMAVSLLLCTLPLLLELLILSVAALLPAKRQRLAQGEQRCSLAVVIPAHNEAMGIAASVRSVLASHRKPDAVYVIAHNCSDETAEHAVAAGAEALPLRDDGAHGKGAALHFGMNHALQKGHTAVLVVDADSTVGQEVTEAVVQAMQRGADAVQARYIAANTGTTRTQIMALSLTGINVVRPRGRSRLGLSCGIFGNGFAVSAATLRQVPYTAHSVVEDLEYHLALVACGRRVTFLDWATVFGELPDNDRAASTQRARWEGGRARIRRQFVPKLARAVLRGRLRLLEPLLDLLSIPLASVVPLLFLLLLLPMSWSRAYALAGFATLLLYVAAAIRLSAEPAAMSRALLAIPGYLIFKLGLLRQKRRTARGDAAWVRTARNQSSALAEATEWKGSRMVRDGIAAPEAGGLQ